MSNLDVQYSTTATEGSNAYVLAPEMPETAKPVEPRPERKPQIATVKSAQPQTKYGVSLIGIVGFLAAAAMLVFVLLGYVKLNDVANTTSQLEETLEELTEDERRLRIEYEKVFDINEIEQFATTELGMTKPSSSQMFTIDVTPPDKAEILIADEGSAHPVRDFISFIKSLTEYFL